MIKGRPPRTSLVNCVNLVGGQCGSMWPFLILYKYRNHREMQIKCTLVLKKLLTSKVMHICM